MGMTSYNGVITNKYYTRHTQLQKPFFQVRKKDINEIIDLRKYVRGQMFLTKPSTLPTKTLQTDSTIWVQYSTKSKYV